MKKKKLPVILGVIFVIGFIAALVLSSGGGNTKFRAEVCITFDGRKICRNAASATKEEAERIAATAACTDLTSGMTALMQCEQSAPRQVTWKD
jgi:hypothetical protein